MFSQQSQPTKVVELPQPEYEGAISVEQGIHTRKSVRTYQDTPLKIKEVGQLLWAAGGVKSDAITGASRTYPSAGATYPQELYLVVGNVEGLLPGIYQYHPFSHKIKLIKQGDFRKELCWASLGQACIQKAPMSLVFTVIYGRTTSKYGDRGVRYVHMDIGFASENTYLQAESLGLGTVAIGAFHDEEVGKILGLSKEKPLLIMPVGKTRE